MRHVKYKFNVINLIHFEGPRLDDLWLRYSQIFRCVSQYFKYIKCILKLSPISYDVCTLFPIMNILFLSVRVPLLFLNCTMAEITQDRRAVFCHILVQFSIAFNHSIWHYEEIHKNVTYQIGLIYDIYL